MSQHYELEEDGAEDQPRQLYMLRIAHDLLIGVVTGVYPCPAGTDMKQVEHYAEALCWVLGHMHPGSAAEEFHDMVIKLSDHILRRAGVQMSVKVN